MRKLLFVFSLALLLTACVPGTVTSQYEIKVTGDAGMKFSGSYMVVEVGGSSTSKSVEGTVPASYSVAGSMVSVAFQKQSDTGGRLKVAILKGGKVAKESETTAAYGMVTVATD
jgi:hypothetical protein